jgi:TRAP-type C4-dicarboxylate transport system substrate-binding protein
LGAPLSITPAEQYEALLRKTCDANASPVAAIIDFKFYEVAKYFTTFNLGDRNHALIISEAAFAKLSPTDQKIIEDLAPDYQQIAYDACATGLEPRGTDVLLKNGVKFITPSAGDAMRLLVASDEVAAAWVKEMDSKGLRERPNDHIKLLSRSMKRSPYKSNPISK